MCLSLRVKIVFHGSSTILRTSKRELIKESFRKTSNTGGDDGIIFHGVI